MRTTKYDLINTPDWDTTTENVRHLLKDLHTVTDGESRYSENTPLEVGSGWSVTLVECKGGGEGDGDEHWLVYKLENVTQAYSETYWKVPGWYQSYYGAELEWENAYQVESYEKTVIAWREKK
jgi:hypothetical protein